jgi:hypothetical protein
VLSAQHRSGACANLVRLRRCGFTTVGAVPLDDEEGISTCRTGRTKRRHQRETVGRPPAVGHYALVAWFTRAVRRAACEDARSVLDIGLRQEAILPSHKNLQAPVTFLPNI